MHHTRVAVILLMLGSMSAAAAEISYDLDKTLILDGRIVSVDWSGEQLKFVVFSHDGYDGANWNVVGPKPADLYRMGWTKDTLKSGDKLDTVVHPDKSGARNGSLMRFYLTDGRTLEISRYGTTQMIPIAELNYRFANPDDDPMQHYYGNTVAFKADHPDEAVEANYHGHVWFNSDRTLTMFANDKNADGTWREHMLTGIWWLEKQGAKYNLCMTFNNATSPLCHSPANFEKVGDKWDIHFRGREHNWVEHRELEAGRH